MEANPGRGTLKAAQLTMRGVVPPALLLGIGLGGLFDGIVLHQILQWHHMLTSQGSYPATTLKGLESNTLWDGLFHATTYVVLVAGLILWTTAQADSEDKSLRPLVGWILVGWGLFNLIEGIVNHHMLQIHHVRSGADQLGWDLAFLALGAVLIFAGQLLARSGEDGLAEQGRAGDSAS